MTNIANITMHGSHVEFDAEGRHYRYMPTKGRLYVGAAGTPVHEAPDGSFEISERCTGSDVASHAKLLGAQVYVAR